MSRFCIVVLFGIAGVAIWIFATRPADSHPDVQLSTALNVTTHAAAAKAEFAPNLDKQNSTPPQWVLSPPAVTSVAEPARELNPCSTPDRGFGSYEAWEQTLPKGQMLCPKAPAKDADGNVRVMFHFHGHEAVRKEWVQITGDVALVALDLGDNSSPYANEFADPSGFAALLASAEQALEKRLGYRVAIGRFGLSAWSAGYAAVRAILNSEYARRVDAVILLDGLHASTLESVAGRAELAPFVAFAQRAAQDEALMFVSHSTINPPDYISTAQGTSYLMWSLGGNPQQAQDTSSFPAGLNLYRRFDRAGFHALGFRGTTKEDHCAQMALYGYVLRTYVLPRWGLKADN